MEGKGKGEKGNEEEKEENIKEKKGSGQRRG